MNSQYISNQLKYRILTLLFALFVALGAYSQNKLSGVIIDEKSKVPLAGVTILDTKSGKGDISNDIGEFSLAFDDFPVIFSFRHLGYFEDSLRIESKDQYQKYFENKTVLLTLRLNPFKLDEVVVSTPGLATKLFEDEPYAIIDYVVKDNRFIALGYKNYNPLKREIFLGKLSGKIISSIPLPSSKEIFEVLILSRELFNSKSST